MFALIVEKTPEPEMGAPEGVVLAYHNFKLSGISDDRVESVNIRFAVPKAWVTENNIDKAQVSLNRYTTEWEMLESTSAGEDSTYFYYQAPSPGLSIFAITGQEVGTAPRETPTTDGEQTTEPPSGDGSLLIPIIVIIAFLTVLQLQ